MKEENLDEYVFDDSEFEEFRKKDDAAFDEKVRNRTKAEK
jgi:hypothetical protein